MVKLFCVAVGMRLGSVDSTEHGMFMEVNWLNIMLVVKFVVQAMMIFMHYFMASLVLVLVIVALTIVSKAMCMLIGSHVTI